MNRLPHTTIHAAALFGAASLFAANAQAGIMQTFDTDPTLAPSQTAGAWYTDRFAPDAFESVSFDGDNRLRHGIDDSDGANNRPSSFSSSFYNTQGRKYDIFAGLGSTMGIDLYVPAAWETTGRRMAGMWGTTTNSGGSISGFPIIEFASDGTDGRFQIFTQDTGQDPSCVPGTNCSPGFIDLGLPSDFLYDEWYRLETTLTPTAYEFSLAAVTGTSTDTLSYTDVVTFGSVQIDNVILQGHNTQDGVTYDIYWDNFSVSTVPTPGTLALIGLGLAGIGWQRRRSTA